MNDLLVRDLGGPISTEDVHKLFSPAPFGEPRPRSHMARLLEQPASVERLMQMGSTDNAEQITEPMLRSAKPEAPEQTAWRRLGRESRAALRVAALRAPCVLGILNKAILHFLHGQSERLQLPGPKCAEPQDAFQRLLVHSLASFYGLASSSEGSGKGRIVTVHRHAALPAASAVPDVFMILGGISEEDGVS